MDTEKQHTSCTESSSTLQTQSYIESCLIQMRNDAELTASSDIIVRLIVRLMWHEFHT